MSENQGIIAHEEKGFCMQLICQLLVSAGMVVWEIFTIMALVNNSDAEIKAICGGSNLWGALLATCIIVGLNLLVHNKPRSNDDPNKSGATASCLALGIFIWLCVELFNDCAISKLRNNNIHILGYIYFWIIIAIISLMFLVLICGGCIFCVAAVTEENGKSQSQRQSESQSQSENMVLDKI
jgi:hypothetical protein